MTWRVQSASLIRVMSRRKVSIQISPGSSIVFPKPLHGWGPPPPLNPRKLPIPPLRELPSLPTTLWPDGPDTQKANDVVRRDFSALQNFRPYQPSYLPSGNAPGSVAPFIPAGSLPTGPLMTRGATQGAGYVGSALEPPIPFVRDAPSTALGGLPGLLIEVGPSDPLNPDTPPAGGLLGLIREHLRNNSRGSN